MKNCLLSGLTKWIIRGSSSCCLAILVACTPAKVQLNVVPLPNDMEIKTGDRADVPVDPCSLSFDLQK